METPEYIEAKVIKQGASINISVPEALYGRIQNLLLAGIPFKDIESLQKSLQCIINKEEDPNPETYHMRTLLHLVSLIEDAAEKQGQTEIKKIDKSTGKPV